MLVFRTENEKKNNKTTYKDGLFDTDFGFREVVDVLAVEMPQLYASYTPEGFVVVLFESPEMYTIITRPSCKS